MIENKTTKLIEDSKIEETLKELKKRLKRMRNFLKSMILI